MLIWPCLFFDLTLGKVCKIDKISTIVSLFSCFFLPLWIIIAIFAQQH